MGKKKEKTKKAKKVEREAIKKSKKGKIAKYKAPPEVKRPDQTKERELSAPQPQSAAIKHLKPQIDPYVLHHMIAEAAYYLAEQQGFTSGREEENWYLAEKQIEAKLLKNN